MVVDDADRGFESQLQGAAGDGQGVFGMGHAAAENGVDVDIELRVLRQPLQFSVEHLQALLGDFVRHYVVDRDLQVFEAGAVQPLDPLRGEQVAVGDDGGDGSVTADGAMISSRSGWRKGSPPLMVMMPVPSLARISIRRSISAVGTGSETLSYSLQ